MGTTVRGSLNGSPQAVYTNLRKFNITQMRNNVEHYVVRPNTPTGDWYYEYSTPSNSTSELTKLQNQLDRLKTTVNDITDNMSDIISNSIYTVLQGSSVLDTKLDRLIQNNSIVAAIQNRLANHINDQVAHVTASDKQYWNEASDSINSVTITINDGELNI